MACRSKRLTACGWQRRTCAVSTAAQHAELAENSEPHNDRKEVKKRMIYLIDPKDVTNQACILYCGTRCKGVVYPLYGVPPDTM